MRAISFGDHWLLRHIGCTRRRQAELGKRCRIGLAECEVSFLAGLAKVGKATAGVGKVAKLREVVEFLPADLSPGIRKLGNRRLPLATSASTAPTTAPAASPAPFRVARLGLDDGVRLERAHRFDRLSGCRLGRYGLRDRSLCRCLARRPSATSSRCSHLALTERRHGRRRDTA